MAWELKLAPLWTEDAPRVDGLGIRVDRENAEAERLMNDGWKVIATSHSSSTPYRVHLVMKRKKNA